MALDTVLLVVRPGDEGYGKTLAGTLVDTAKPANARAIVAEMFTEDECDATLKSLDLDAESEVTPEKIADQHRTINTVTEHLNTEGLDHDVRCFTGPHSETITDIAADADLLIIGGRERSPAGKAFFGSTTQEVLLDAPCPVVFVRRE